MKKGFVNGKLDPSKYSSVFCLSTHNSINYELGTRILIESLLIAYFLTKKLKLSQLWQFDLNGLKNDQWFLRFFRFVEYNNCLKHNNRLPVVLRTIDERELQNISSGITPCFSFFNHSCIPMIIRHIQSEHVITSSVVPIKRGEQIFDNYCTGFVVHDKPARDSVLSLMDFNCKCEACINDWPRLSEMPRSHDDILDCAFEKCQSRYEMIFNYARENNQIMDLSKERYFAMKLVEHFHRESKVNSWKALRALTLLQTYIHFDQRPLLYLN